MYFIKKLGSQELGSVSESRPTPQRGRYIYISKDPLVLSFFPILSQTTMNDMSLLLCVNLDNTSQKDYLIFVYNNSKYTDLKFQNPLNTQKGRDEYRIYLNNEFDRVNPFSPDDILIIKRVSINESESEYIYFMKLIKVGQDNYTDLNNLIPSRGATTITQSIPYIDNMIEQYSKNETQQTILIGDSLAKIQNINTQKSYEDIFTLNSFRDFVLVSYNYRCAITSTVINWGNFYNIEAAHIYPKSRRGSNMPNNGIAMNRDMHWAFDKGFFTIRDNYTIEVHSEIDSDFLQQYNNKLITLPQDDFMKPDQSNLAYHRENIYGLFKTTGRL